MKGMKIQLTGKKLVITVDDVTKSQGTSKSGKSKVIATTEGNVSLPKPHDDVKIGLNVYTAA